MVQVIEANFTVDTGATITMMSRDVYEWIPETNRPPLDKCSSPATAEGRLMKAYGSAVFGMDLGPLMLDKTIAEAELADEVLLGADVLQFDPGGPADLILSQGVMVLRGKSIPVLQIGSRTMVRKVRSADHYALPPMTEMTVDAFVDDMALDTQLLIEPSLYLAAKEYFAVVAPCLIDASRQCTVKVQIMNPTCEVISVKQDMVLGDVTSTEGEPMVLLDEESNDGNKSLSHARLLHDMMCEPETRRSTNEAPLIPDHLRVTFQTTCNICETDEQKNKIEHLLNQFSPIFSMSHKYYRACN